MTTEWKDLTTLQDVAKAQADGWEIEVFDESAGVWCQWASRAWYSNRSYRGRPKQQKTRTVTSECWRAVDGQLSWVNPMTTKLMGNWQRFPAGDFVGEVDE